MKNEERLLSDVLRTKDYDLFQSGVADAMVMEVRRGKTRPRRRALWAIAACVPLAMGILIWRGAGKSGGEENPRVAVGPGEGLPTGMLVRTQGRVEVVQTKAEVELVPSGFDPVALLSDAELLEMLQGQSVGLVHARTGAKLVFPENGIGSLP